MFEIIAFLDKKSINQKKVYNDSSHKVLFYSAEIFVVETFQYDGKKSVFK